MIEEKIKIPIEAINIIAKNWTPEDVKNIQDRVNGQEDVCILRFYKLLTTSQISYLLRLCGYRNIDNLCNEIFKDSFKEPEDISKLNDVYYGIYEKSLKQAIREAA